MTKNADTRSVEIKAPRLHVVEFEIVGTAPYVQHRFSAKAINQIIATQEAGTQAKSKKKREPKVSLPIRRTALLFSIRTSSVRFTPSRKTVKLSLML